MVTIQKYVKEQLVKCTSEELTNKLKVSLSMISAYKHHGYNTSLKVAKLVYLADNIVLHPFSEESIKYEIQKDK